MLNDIFIELSICFKSADGITQSVILKLKPVKQSTKSKISPLQAVSSWTTLHGVYIKYKILIYLELKQSEDNKSGRTKLNFENN